MKRWIRTVKPQLFEHEGLFELEKKTGLPIRLAFIGLLTCADREGRFEWKPRVIQKDILPWDGVDFGKILDALAAEGLVKKYDVGGKLYGFFPTWKAHQYIGNKEAKSKLPPPPPDSLPNNSQEITGELPSNYQEITETLPGNSVKEEEEEEEEKRESETNPPQSATADPPPDIQELWNANCGALPRIRRLSADRLRTWQVRWREEPDEGFWVNAIKRVAASPFCNGENDRGWRANIDFLLRQGRANRAQEGLYDGKGSSGSVRYTFEETEESGV